MVLDRRFPLLSLFSAALLLTACGGGKGSSAPPPPDFKVQATDQAVTMTWTNNPGVDYWVFVGPPGTTPENFTNTPGAYPYVHATSPYTVYGQTFNNVANALVNGRQYAVTINGRINGGPGGSWPAPQIVTPTAAGGTWTAGAPLVNKIDNAADDLFAGAFGQPLTLSNGALYSNGLAPAFVYTGHNGAAHYSTLASDGQTYGFTSISTGVASGTDLNALAYGQSLGFLTAGSGGQASLSLDGLTWTPQSTGTARTFRALAATSGSTFIATGDGCMVYGVATGGTTQTTVWTDFTTGFSSSAAFSAACASGTPPALLGTVLAGGYATAVGTQGTLAFSSGFGSTTAAWAAASPSYPAGVSAASVTLRSVMFGTVYETQSNGLGAAVPLWVAVGDYTDSGNVVHPLILYTTASPTVVNSVATWSSWTAAALPAGLPAGTHLNSISAATDPINGGLTQLFVVGDNGVILNDLLSTPVNTNGVITPHITSTPAQSWALYAYPTGQSQTASLRALAHGHYGLQAVGTAGTRLFTY